MTLWALTELETWRAATAPLAVAATGGPLLERIRRVLGAPAAARRRPPAMVAAIWSVLFVLLLTGGAQAITALQPDAVVEDPTLKGYTGRDLIRLAYDVPAARVVGGPGWLDDESLDVSTRLDEDPGADGIQAVVRTMLESRLGLTVHIEPRDFPAYALVSTTSLPGAPGLQWHAAASRRDAVAARRDLRADGGALRRRRRRQRPSPDGALTRRRSEARLHGYHGGQWRSRRRTTPGDGIRPRDPRRRCRCTGDRSRPSPSRRTCPCWPTARGAATATRA